MAGVPLKIKDIYRTTNQAADSNLFRLFGYLLNLSEIAWGRNYPCSDESEKIGASDRQQKQGDLNTISNASGASIFPCS